MTLFETIDQKLITLLTPLVSTLGVKGIQREFFTDSGGAGELLDKYRNVLPAAFLAPPQVVYPQRDSRVSDIQLSYSFLVVFAVRDTKVPRDSYYRFHDALLTGLFYAELSSVNCPFAQIDFVRPNATTYAEAQSEAAMLITFSVTIRNWRRS